VYNLHLPETHRNQSPEFRTSLGVVVYLGDATRNEVGLRRTGDTEKAHGGLRIVYMHGIQTYLRYTDNSGVGQQTNSDQLRFT
jgi:hypothetical protein